MTGDTSLLGLVASKMSLRFSVAGDISTGLLVTEDMSLWFLVIRGVFLVFLVTGDMSPGFLVTVDISLGFPVTGDVSLEHPMTGNRVPVGCQAWGCPAGTASIPAPIDASELRRGFGELMVGSHHGSSPAIAVSPSCPFC